MTDVVGCASDSELVVGGVVKRLEGGADHHVGKHHAKLVTIGDRLHLEFQIGGFDDRNRLIGCVELNVFSERW